MFSASFESLLKISLEKKSVLIIFDIITRNQLLHCLIFLPVRTKWKRQTAVGLELLTEASNLAAVQRVLQINPYWASFHPQANSIISTLDTLLPHLAHPVSAGQEVTSMVGGVISPRATAIPRHAGLLNLSAFYSGSSLSPASVVGLGSDMDKRV